MGKSLRQLGHYLLIGILLVSMGGHLLLLQTVAWGSMLVDFSHKGSVTEAIEKTFSGEHPCCLCKLVKKSKDEGEKVPLIKAEMKWEVAFPKPIKMPYPRSVDLEFCVTAYSASYASVHLAVLIQPPRAV